MKPITQINHWRPARPPVGCPDRGGWINPIRILAAGLAAWALLGSEPANSQAISPYLIGQNAWMPSWYGGQINQLWDEMQTARFQTIRIGGNGAMSDNKNLTRVISLIDGVRSAGAEPIVQVPHDYSAQQTIDYINYLNSTMGRGIKLWCIGNEPDNNNVGDAAFVGTYLRLIGSALKTVDPAAVVMGPETAWYNTTYLTPLVGGSADVTGIDANGNYPIDIITWHTYNFNTIGGVEANVNDILGRLAIRNASRPANKQLSWGIGEINTHWDMALVSNPDQYTWSFHAGQLFAELYDLGMRKSGFTICPWAMHEHSGNRSGTDLSLFDTQAEGFPGRSTYYHSLMLGQNLKSNYLAHTDNQSDVKVISLGDATGTTVMLLNQSKVTPYDYALKLDLGAVAASALQIKVDAGRNVQHLGSLPAHATHLLVFDANGQLLKRCEYTSLHAEARQGPVVTESSADTLLVHYQMGQLAPQIQNAAETVAGSNLTPGAGLNLFDVYFNTGNYPSQPVVQVNFKTAGTNLAAAWAKTNWFSFTLTVGTNLADLDLTSLSFSVARGGSSTPRGYAVYVTTPTTTQQLVRGTTDVNAQRPTWEQPTIDLSGVTSLQNLTAGQVVTFTIPLYAPTASVSLEFDDLKVRGIASRRILITHLEMQAASATLRWTSTPGKSYAVDGSVNLQTWMPLATNLAATVLATETTATLDLAGGSERLFFRVRQE